MGKIKHQTINSRTDFFYSTFRNILFIGLPLLVVSGLVLSLSNISATSGTDNLTISIYTACTLSSTVNNEHNTVVDVGTYRPNIGKTTITTLCNDGNGYSIYDNGFSNNEEGNNKLINSTYPQYSIDTGLSTSGLTSQWAMKLNNIENDPSPTPPSIDSSYNDTYGLIPNTWTKVAYRQSGTTDMSEGSSFTTTYSVYASSSQYNGTYNGQVKYVLLHPYKNDSTITTVPTFEESFAISGKETVSINDEDYYKMQDMNSYICERVSNAAETPTIQLVDIRDNKIYWVAKLADNNCWMTQNLDLDLSHEVALTSETSDIDPSTYGSGIYTEAAGYSKSGNVISWTPSTIVNGVDQADTKTMNWTSNTAATVSDWINNANSPYSADAGDRYRYTNTSGNETIYTSLRACEAGTNDDTAGCEHMHLGNYYNWSAAVASNNTSSASDGQTNSICPKNWDLPANGEYGTMLKNQSVWTGSSSAYDTDGYLKIRTSPLYFVRSGRIDNGSISSFNIYGGYWFDRVFNSSNSYYLFFGASSVSSATNIDRSYGLFIRCMINSS